MKVLLPFTIVLLLQMHGNSFQRKLAILKNGVAPTIDVRHLNNCYVNSNFNRSQLRKKIERTALICLLLFQKPKRRAPVTSQSGRSSAQEKPSQRSRSVSFSPERVRVRGRSPAFNALAANFEKSDTRNLSTPPPVVKKLYPKSVTPDKTASPKSASIASVTSFEKPTTTMIPKVIKGILLLFLLHPFSNVTKTLHAFLLPSYFVWDWRNHSCLSLLQETDK